MAIGDVMKAQWETRLRVGLITLAWSAAVTALGFALVAWESEKRPSPQPAPVFVPRETPPDQLLDSELASAADAGDLAAVQRLVAEGARVDTRLNISYPLHAACGSGHLEVVKYLVAHGADPLLNAEEGGELGLSGWSTLYPAVLNNHPDVVDYLLRVREGFWRNVPGELMVLAANLGHVRVVEVFLRHGVDPDYLGKEHYMSTALRMALSEKHLDVVKVLLAYGADVGASPKSSASPLFVAIDSGDLRITQLLLARGASTVAKDRGSALTPLEYARERGNKKMIALVRRYSRR